MCDGSQLKDAVYDYVSDLNRSTDTTQLYYINSCVIPYKENLTSYIKDLNPTTFRAAGGNMSNTDLGSCIATVLSTLNDTTVAVFISDCILDLPAKDAQKFLVNCEIRIKDEVINARKQIPDLGVEVLKLLSNFNGMYYYPNGSVEVLQGVERPYYIWIFGNKNYLAKLNEEVPLSMLSKYKMEGFAAFTNLSAIPFDIKNRNLTGAVINPSHGNYGITVRADFRATLQPDEVILDKKNYTFNNGKLTVEGVYPITDKNSEYTHYINLTIPGDAQIAQECLALNTPEMPAWVSASNDDSGLNVKNNLSKTTGIKFLIQGVADAYKTEKISGQMKFNVKRK